MVNRIYNPMASFSAVNKGKKKLVACPLYGAIVCDDKGFAIALVTKDGVVSSEYVTAMPSEVSGRVMDLLKEYERQRQAKIVAVALQGKSLTWSESLGARLWLKRDIVPHLLPPSHESQSRTKSAEHAAKMVMEQYTDAWIARGILNDMRAVQPSYLVQLRDQGIVTPKEDFLLLQKLAEHSRRLKMKIVFFSSTPNGGGVALMRHALIRLYRLLGVDASWHVMSPNEEVFKVTKLKFHNVLQAIAPISTMLNNKDKAVYNDWIQQNAKTFFPVYQNADVIIIDDPQPSGLIPFIRKANPNVKIIYRSHIQIRSDLTEKKGTSQARTWDFLKRNILLADLFVSHPLSEFVPKDIPKDKVVYMPATTDPLDGLNKELTGKQRDWYRHLFNELLSQVGQTALDFDRPYFIQVARFDPSKGIPDVIEAYRRFRKKFSDLDKPLCEVPQLVLVGNGAIDDPEGVVVLEEILMLLEMERYSPIAKDIKIIRVPHIDQLLNMLLRGSTVALQLSHREGFEVKVTEALAKGIPVVAYKTGGIPLQIRHAVDGFLVKTGNTKMVAERLFQLVTDKKLHEKMSKNAMSGMNHEYWTAENALKWLFLATELYARGSVAGNKQSVRRLIELKETTSKKKIL